MNKVKKIIIVLSLGIPAVILLSALDLLISKNYTYTQYFGAGLIEYGIFVFGVWIGFEAHKWVLKGWGEINEYE